MATKVLPVQQLAYEELGNAPRDIRIAATIALLSASSSRVIGILSSTAIIALLLTWFQGVLSLQPLPVALLVLTLGSFFLARSASHNRARIAARQFEQVRSSSLTWTILGFIVGGIIPGILNLLLYMRIGSIMVKRRPDDPITAYLLPSPSQGLFLGRFLGWLAAYFLALYLGYTLLPQGLGSVSGWLSPIFGVHFNTLIVAAYLAFGNPLAYPQLLQIWATVGLIGGLIAGGRVRRGFIVGLTAFLSTLGAMGLAALAIFRNFSFAALSSIPPIPPGFSLTSVLTGPVANDVIPLVLQASSPTDPAFVENLALTLLRNMLLVVAVVTISGRAGCLLWQGGAFLIRHVSKTVRRKPTPAEKPASVEKAPAAAPPEPKTLKIGVLLMLIAMGTLVFLPSPGLPVQIRQAPPAGPYQQNLAVGLSMLGAPNASLRLTNLDLSSRGLVMNSNYDNTNFTAFIINNNYPQAFGSGPATLLRLFSEPTLIVSFTTDLTSATAKADEVAAQFGQALGIQFTRALALRLGPEAVAIYSPTPSLTNSEALRKVLAALPSTSFSSLISPSKVEEQRYFAMLGILPSFNGITTSGFSFLSDVNFPRAYYKEGPHQLSLKTLLGFQGGISSDPGANASVVSMTFQKGTIVYSPLGPNPYYDNSSSTYYLNATVAPTPDLYANFTYPFAPNIVVTKVVTPAAGSVGSTRSVISRVQNLDTVTVENLNLTDPETSQSYQTTLRLAPSGSQLIPLASFAGGSARTMTYDATPMSSGTYVLSPLTAEFLWTAGNGSRIRYSIHTDEIILTSTSGPMLQFTNTFNDLWPYSILLALFFVLTPTVQLVRRLRKMRRRHTPEREIAY